MNTQIDTGGTNAIKGFNYQHAVSVLILLLHHEKDDFYIIPEGLDDIQIFDNGTSHFLQVKGKKITAGNLVIPTKKQTESMIEKLVNKKSEYTLNNEYKIVCIESNCTLTDNKVESKLFYSPYEPDINYIYSFDIKPIEKLKKFGSYDEDKQEQLRSIIKRIKCYITPFKNSSDSYQPYLMGTISNLGVDISPTYQENALRVLKDFITSRSEIIISDEKDAKDKAIHTSDIRYLFEEAELHKELKELIFNSIDDYLGTNTGLKFKLKSIVLGIIDNLEIDAHYIKVKEILYENKYDLQKLIYKSKEYIDFSLILLEDILHMYERNVDSNHDTLSRVIVYYCLYLQGSVNHDNK